MDSTYTVYAQHNEHEELYGPTLCFNQKELGEYMSLFFTGIRDPLEWSLVVAYRKYDD